MISPRNLARPRGLFSGRLVSRPLASGFLAWGLLAWGLLAVGLLAPTAAAQAAPNRFVPDDAQLVVRFAAPAKWAKEFGDTKIAGVLAGPTFGPMLEQMQQGFIAAMTGGSAIEKELAESLWTDYGGDITIAVHVDLEDLPTAIQENRPPALAIVFAMSPDGEFDLAELGRQAGDAFENQGGGEFAETTVGDHTLRYKLSDQLSGSKPMIVDDHLVSVFATNVEESAVHLLSSEARHDHVGAGKALFVRVEPAGAVRSLLDFLSTQMDNDFNAPPFDVAQLLTDMGMTSLQNLELSLAPDGEQLVMEVGLGFNDAERGLFGALTVDKSKLDTLRYVPPAADTFSVQVFDLAALYDTVAKMAGSMSAVLPMTWADIEASFTEATKVRLREDLIARIGKEMLTLTDWQAQMEAADENPDDIGNMFAGSCYAIALTDGKAFGESLETALRARGMHAARKSEDYQGVTVYRLRLGGVFEVEYAVTDDLLLLALGSGDASRAQLRSILDARANPVAGLPEAVAEYEGRVPAGWNSVGVTPMATMLTMVANVIQQAPPGELPPQAEQAAGILTMLGKEMKRAGVDDAVQFGYSSPKGIRSILRL